MPRTGPWRPSGLREGVGVGSAMRATSACRTLSDTHGGPCAAARARRGVAKCREVRTA